MHSDQSVRHIALTCPHCGKHYNKVPYDAIRKHRFAFCKQCNTKFPVEPSVLEEALRQATLALAGQSIEVSASTNQHKAPATAQEGEHEAATERAAQDFSPAPHISGARHDDSTASQLFASHKIEIKEQPGITGSFEQKINTLAAKIEETFGQPQEAIPAVDSGRVPFENIFGDTLIDKMQANPVLETQGNYTPLSSAADIQELKGLSFEELIKYQSDETAVEKVSGPEVSEASMIREQAFDATRETKAYQEIEAEPLPEDELIAASPQTAFYDDTLEEVVIGEQAFDATLGTKAYQGIEAEPLPEDQFIAASPQTAFYDDTLEEVVIGEQAFDATRETKAYQEIEAEPLLEDQFVTSSAETDFGEEAIDECLIEDQIPEQSEQDMENAIRSQEKNPIFPQSRELKDLTHNGFLASRVDTGANREVSAMLKDIVLPTADVEEGTEQFVLFYLGDQLFAAPIANVFELSLPPEVIMVPNTPQWMMGIANMRGEIISIVDLMGFLNMGQENLKKPSRMIVAQTNDRQMMLGLIVDSINGIKYFAADEILPVQHKAPGQSAAYLNGALAHEDTMAAIFDFEKLLQSSKMRQFQ